MKAIGIKDVALAAGVSPATVSRTLAGRAVDAEMRKRVEAAVAATGYRPNLAARRLRSRDTGTIGLIVADIRNPFFTAVARAVEDAAYARGLRVILCNTDEDPAREALYLRLMEEERVTGAILAPTRGGGSASVALDVPAVLIDRSPSGGARDAVVLNNRAAAAMLVDHLVAQGYRRIAGLFGANSTTGRERCDGYGEALARHGLAADAGFVAHGPGITEAAVRALLDRPVPPDALIASNGVMLLSAVRALNAMNVACPRTLGLAGFDNEPWTEIVAGGLTVIEQPVERIGGEAMTMLMDRIAEPQSPPRQMMLGGGLVVRGSTPGPAGR